MPIYLVDNADTVSKATLDSMKACGIKNVRVVGGRFAVSEKTLSTLRSNGFTVARTAGNTAYDTSKAIADWGIKTLKMKADKMGVACGLDFKDALCGAPFCGKNNAVLVLADSRNSKTCRPVASDNKDQIVSGYVFGGIYAVPKAVMNDYERASGCPVSK